MSAQPPSRRRAILRFLAIAPLAIALGLSFAQAGEIIDATGRTVTFPDQPDRVFAAGPPASALLYAVKPEAMVGWVRAPRAGDLPYLLESTHAQPEVGRLTGRGDALNLDGLRATEPDLIVDFGTVNDSYRGLAERVQDETGVPYALLDGSLANTPAAIRQIAEILGVPERGAALAAYAEETFAAVDATLAQAPEATRPSVYLARGADGLETAGPNSINAEILTRVGARNVVRAENDGLANISPEQIRAWAPEVIVTIDPDFAANVGSLPEWAEVPAVREDRVYLAPSAPFGFIDSPPSVNRLIGLHWLLDRLYPDHAEGDPVAEVQRFYGLFYQVDLDDAAAAALLGG